MAAKALITGATGGIGRAVALALAEAGYEVYALGRDAAALDRLRSDRPEIVPVSVDLTDRDTLERAIAGLEVDVLINNAGIMPPLGNFADMAMADIDAALATNLGAAIVLTRLVVPQMRARRSGHVLFTGSVAGHQPFANIAVYSATKAAISGFAAALRADLSPSGVRVTEIAAGRVETGLYRDILPEEAIRAMYADRGAVQPEDLARMVLAVLSLPQSADVTRFDIMPTWPTSPSGTLTGAKPS